MPAPPAPVKYNAGEVFQVQLIGELSGRRNMNVFAFEAKRNNLYVSDIGDDINYMAFLLRLMCVTEMKWVAWKHRRVMPHPITQFQTISMFVSPGVREGPAAHPSLCVLYRINTAIDAKWARGRFYVPGMPRDNWDGHAYTFGARQNIQNTMSSIFDQWKSPNGFSGNQYLGVWSRGDHDTPFNRMIGMDWGPYPAMQRRRGYY